VDYLAENTYLIRHAIDGVIEYVEGLERGDYVDHRNRYGRTALMEAALCGHSDFVEELIEVGAEKDLEDNEGCTALDLAENCGRNKQERLRRSHPGYSRESFWKDCKRANI
jgi:hypothetical protein